MFDIMGKAKIISNSIDKYTVGSIDIDSDDNKIVKIEGRYDNTGFRVLNVFTITKVRRFGLSENKNDSKNFVINFDKNEELIKVFGCLNINQGKITHLY